MRKYLCPIIAALVAATATGHAAVAEDAGHMVLVPSGGTIKWQAGPPNLPKGSQIAVLAGDPAKPGPFACA